MASRVKRTKAPVQRQPWGKITVMAVLWVLLVLSALGVVYSTYLTRINTNELEALRKVSSDLQIEAGKLLLEKSSLGAYARVEMIAKKELAMRVPSHENVIVIKRVNRE